MHFAFWAVPAVLAMTACGGGSGSPEAARIAASADGFTRDWNTAATLDVLGNDSSSAGALQLAAVGTPAHGSARIQGNQIEYTPAAGYFGTDAFTYTVSSGAFSATATVTMQIHAALTLKGRAYDAPLPGAAIRAEVDGTVYSTTADADGYFHLPIRASQPSQFVTLTAIGAGKQAHVKLTSLVGDMAGVAAGVTASGEVPADAVAGLNVTHVSTAQAALAAVANGGEAPATQAALKAAVAQVRPEQLLQMAAMIKLVADHGVALPAGVSDTAELVHAPEIYARFAEEQLLANRAAVNDAQHGIETDPFFAVAPAPVTAAITRVFYSGKGCCTAQATAITLRPDGTATLFTNYWGAIDGKWTAAAGVTRFTPNRTAVGEPYVFSEGWPDDKAYSAQDHLTEWAWRQVAGDTQQATVSVWSTGRFSYTPVGDAPAKADLAYGGPDSAQLSRLDEMAALAVPEAAELVAAPLAGLPSVPSLDGSVLVYDQDTAVFRADGSGTLERTGLAFTWTRSDHALTLNFRGGFRMVAARSARSANGEQRWLVRQDREKDKAWVTKGYVESMLVAVDARQGFTVAELTGLWHSSVNAGLVTDQTTYLQLDADQKGSVFTRYLNGQPDALSTTFTWRVEAGSVIMLDTRGGANSREWTKLHQSGNTIFVMEKLANQWRINRYELTRS